MASKTFSQLYTDALVQCDETAGSGSSTAKTIVKAGINESYAEVAAIRDWETLSNNAAIPLVQGTMEYTPVTASASVCRIRRIQSVLLETSNRFLEEVKRSDFERSYPYVDPTDVTNQGTPTVWFQSSYTVNRDLNLKFWQVPSGAMTARAHFVEEPLELSLDTDVPRIPDQFHYGLTYLGIAKYFEYQKDPISSYYRQLHEQFKQKILNDEWGDTVEMPEISPQPADTSGIVVGKLGRVYNP